MQNLVVVLVVELHLQAVNGADAAALAGGVNDDGTLKMP